MIYVWNIITKILSQIFATSSCVLPINFSRNSFTNRLLYSYAGRFPWLSTTFRMKSYSWRVRYLGSFNRNLFMCSPIKFFSASEYVWSPLAGSNSICRTLYCNASSSHLFYKQLQHQRFSTRIIPHNNAIQMRQFPCQYFANRTAHLFLSKFHILSSTFHSCSAFSRCPALHLPHILNFSTLHCISGV